MSKITVDTIEPSTGTTVTLGGSGDTLSVPSGVTLDVASGGTITNSGTASGFGLFSSYAVIADQKSQNTHGGTFTAGAWQTRDLNTEVFDPDSIVSISTNAFTLAAGTYFIRWQAPAGNCNYHQSRLYNSSDSSVVAVGSSEMAHSSYSVTNKSFGSCRVTIAASKAFIIQHQCSTTANSEGFGRAENFGTEQYTTIEIFKEA